MLVQQMCLFRQSFAKETFSYDKQLRNEELKDERGLRERMKYTILMTKIEFEQKVRFLREK